MAQEIIMGIHSVCHALKNPKRKNIKLFYTNTSQSELDKQKVKLNFDYKNIDSRKIKDSEFQEHAVGEFKNLDINYTRVPSNIFLISQELELKNSADLYAGIEDSSYQKILCLDQITDVHNMAAIFRTASFYGVDAIVISRKGELRLSPSFFRISSGAREYIDFIKATNLSRNISKMEELGMPCVGFSEHEKSSKVERSSKMCLVLGSEDQGLSNAVERNLKNFISLKNKGDIQTLNVSVASAIAMERFF